MPIVDVVIQKEEDGTVRHTVITAQGNAATAVYNEKRNSDSTINDAITRATEEALKKDR